MNEWLHDLYWGDISPVSLVGRHDKQYIETRHRCERLEESLRKKIDPEQMEDFDALNDMWNECSAMVQEHAFALGCGFTLRLMLETLPLLKSSACEV